MKSSVMVEAMLICREFQFPAISQRFCPLREAVAVKKFLLVNTRTF